MIEPRRPYVFVNAIGRLLKLWKSYRIPDAYTCKLLRLWLGYDLTPLMDANGIYRATDFNLIRKALGFVNVPKMLEEISRTRSFCLIGQNRGQIEAFFSPIWHQWSEEDGPLLNLGSSQDMSQDIDRLNKLILNLNPTGGNSDELTPCQESTSSRGSQGGHPLLDNESTSSHDDSIYKRRIVRDYFLWCEKQKDDDHLALVDGLKRRIQVPKNSAGEVMKEKILTDAETDEVWNILIETQLIPTFADRADFFKQQYMQHPEKRIWWMKNYFARFVTSQLVSARKLWERRKLDIAQHEANAQMEVEMQNRPISPHEWQAPNGKRWYINPKGERQPIPADAEPRPSDTSTFNYIRGQWTDSPQPSLVGRE